ncbi:hypothetical protein DUI87_11525 [Hirundo rustica rustica]|uniref:PKD domain-containing protein n=14 Tax=Passeriformes TaxID=9126 RepID=A0A3M0KDX4_HIRRU|nr:hypothetical protein DUI87_11525 [Hirundo rustica rustica]
MTNSGPYPEGALLEVFTEKLKTGSRQRSKPVVNPDQKCKEEYSKTAWITWSSARVILILTKLYDYNLGSITESSLWRSTDYGTTYEKLNDKVGLKTILSYLYVCPTNKRKLRTQYVIAVFGENKNKIMLLTDPEVESSLLISSDEGATYQKYRLNFYIHSLLFHPKQEDWILAYSQDQKLFSSVEFGRRWLLLHEGVTPNRFYWSMMGNGREADLVHLEARAVDGHPEKMWTPEHTMSATRVQASGPIHINLGLRAIVVKLIFLEEVHMNVISHFHLYAWVSLEFHFDSATGSKASQQSQEELINCPREEIQIVFVQVTDYEMSTLQCFGIGDAQYITCKMQNCSEATRSKPFPGYIDHNSLIVQGDYVFVQLTSGGRPHYYVSYRRSPFAQMKLPKYSLPKDMHVISTDENQVFAAVQEWNQNDTYNLYISDTRGVYFTLALENVKSSQGLEGNVMIDLYEVAGIKGMFLANKKIDNQVKTFITYNKGRDWSLLQAPHTDLRGNPIQCLLQKGQRREMKILKTSEMSVCELSYGSWRRNTKGRAEKETAGKISVDELYKDGEGVQGNEEENVNTVRMWGGHVLGSNFRCLAKSGKPYCSLHLHLKVSDNPYTSGNIASRDTAPSIIVASGNIGTELSDSDISMFVTSDAGNTWRQIFEEEHSVLYLDQGGVLVAMKHTSLPIRHLWLSFDEGRSWSKYSFTSLPLFVDGVLGEPGEETLIMTVFGHFSHRSEWQLVKVDYKSIFDRRCAEEDYRPWQLHSQGEACIMGAKRIYRKRKSEKKCMQGKYAGAMTSEPCVCTEADFDCDYGYERHSNGQCLPAFWYNPSSLSKDCSLGQSYLNSTGYRKVVSNNCTDGVRERYTAKPQQCPGKAPQGLRIVTADGRLTAEQGHNVTFLVQLEEGDLQRSLIQVDFGDGIAVSYANLSSTEDGIKHIYQNVGIFRVTVLVENSLGSDSAVLYLHVTCPLEHVHLSLPFVTTKNKEINATAVLWPSQVGTLTYVWWFGNNTEPLITLEGSITFTFSVEGMNTITVQVSAGNTILQDTKTIAVYEKFQSLRLSFSPNLDDYNPDIPEWRRDISRVVKRALVEATGISSKNVLVAVLPGLPTSAELFILPYQDGPGEKKRTEANLEQISSQQRSGMETLANGNISWLVANCTQYVAAVSNICIQPKGWEMAWMTEYQMDSDELQRLNTSCGFKTIESGIREALSLATPSSLNLASFIKDLKKFLLEPISETLIQKLNQNLVHFELKPGVRILVHAAHLTAAPLVDLTPSHSGSAMLMLLSVVFVGLAVFVIYKFKRKIPGLNIYAQMQNEKDQEMVSPVSQRESIPNVPQSELMSPEQLVDEKLEVHPIGSISTSAEPQSTKEIPTYVNG